MTEVTPPVSRLAASPFDSRTAVEAFAVQGGAAYPAMPRRPTRPLSTPQLLRVGLSSTLAAFDEELFDKPIVQRRYVWGRFVMISDPDGIRRVMQDNVDNYPRIDVLHRIFAFTAATGMLAAEGDLWRRHRRLLNPTLDHRAALADLPAFVELSQTLAEHLARSPADEGIDIGQTFAHLVTAMTGRVFAADDRAIDPVLYRLGQYPGKYRLRDFLGLTSGRRDRQNEITAFLPLIDRLIAERRRSCYGGAHDLLWRIANARDRDGDAGLSDAEVRDEVLTLGATAATPLRVFPWLWYLLATYPAVEARLHAELDRVLGGRTPTADDLARLAYLRQIVDETLRLYPPAPTMLRTALADDTVCGCKVAAKSIVGVFPWIVHRHRTLWHDPDRFEPDRFTSDQIAARSRYAYLPFAVGPHVCIGASLALAEIIAAVAVLAQRFRFRLVPGQRIEPIAWTNLHPKGGLRMIVEPREGVPHAA